MGPTMFSGWGIRTYAEDQPGYNPIGYHTGSVWPHDTSLIAAGLKRYGFDDESNRLQQFIREKDPTHHWAFAPSFTLQMQIRFLRTTSSPVRTP